MLRIITAFISQSAIAFLKYLGEPGDGKALPRERFQLFKIENRGRMKIEWHGGPSGARPFFFSVWNGKSYDHTDVRDPGTNVTMDANVPLSQTTIYLLVYHTASGSMIHSMP